MHYNISPLTEQVNIETLDLLRKIRSPNDKKQRNAAASNYEDMVMPISEREAMLRTSKEIKSLQHRLAKIFPSESDKSDIYLGVPKEIEVFSEELNSARIRILDPFDCKNLIFNIDPTNKGVHLDVRVYISLTVREPHEK